MLYPEIPEDTSGLSAAELRKLAIDTRLAARSALATDKSKESVSTARAALEAADALDVEADSAAAAEAQAAADAQAAAEAQAAEEAAAAAAQQQASDTGGDDDDEVDDDDDGGDDDEASAPSTGLALTTTTTTTTAGTSALAPDVIYKVDDDKPVAAFSDWAAFAEACSERAKTIGRNSDRRFEVGRIIPEYPEDRKLTSNAFDNLRKLDTLGLHQRSKEEITADLCAPFTPYYNLACMNTTRRPVAGSLAPFEAPRGGVTIYPSPTLEDVEGSAGIWTREDDADLEAVKNECARITCATPEEFVMYGVYYCLTVKNMLALTFPELLAAYLNRAAANYARVGETQLLDQMGAGLGQINTAALGYGASTRIATQVLHYLALYREMQRWDDVPVVAWAPRWLQVAMQIDLSRRNTRDGRFRLATTAEVDAAFASAGINVTWYLDNPSWGTPPPAAIATGGDVSAGELGTLSALPSEVDILVAPAGKFRMIDRAQLSIGVTGNNWYRDNASNSKNEVTYFFENYEGVVDTTSCPAHILHFADLCYNGAQIADTAMDCAGAEAA